MSSAVERARSGAPAGLDWVDGFFARAREHIFAREEDGVVILPPSQVYKANPTGIAVIRHLLRGRRIAAFPGIGVDGRAAQVNGFLRDVRDLYVGSPAARQLEQVPYTFSYTTLPVLGEIAVTYRCNNACLFCYAGCGTGGCHRGPAGLPDHPAEMTLAEIRQVIRAFTTDAQVPFFSFTGGEPLLRGDLEAMIRFARREGLQVNLITNATLADPGRARRLFRAGLRTAQVSIEAPEPACHDGLTARPGSFAATVRGIENLRRAGISVQTNTTLTAANCAAAPRMPGFLRSLGVQKFSMNLYIPGGPAAAGLFFPYSRAGEVIEAVRAQARAEGMTFSWYSPIPHCLYNPVARGLGNKSCAAMDGLLSVSPQGDVLPCSSYPLPMGNLLRRPFREIWFSDRARHFKNKEYAPAACAGCSRFTACQAACPLYWDHAGTGEVRPCG